MFSDGGRVEAELGTLGENRAGGTGEESAAWDIMEELGKRSLWELRLGRWLCVCMWGRVQVKEEGNILQHTAQMRGVLGRGCLGFIGTSKRNTVLVGFRIIYSPRMAPL